MALPDRQRLILKDIVDRYIRQREPVSSRMILEDYGLHVSSATVRNDMNALEEEGYIEKPYSSSGRVPTRKGYRFFVDWLIDLSELTKKERGEIVEAYQFGLLEVGETLRQTAFLIGNMTGYAGFVIPPQVEETRLSQVVLVKMAPRMVFLVIVSDIGVVEHGLIPLEDELSETDMKRIVELINANLRGATLDAVRSLTQEESPEGWYERPVRQALVVLGRLLDRQIRQQLYSEGMLNLPAILREVSPDLAMERFVALIHALHDEERFTDTIREMRAERSGLVIAVGDSPIEALEDFSLVTAGYGPHGGILGAIGPLWMDYGKALSTVSYVANRLETIFVGSCAASLGGSCDDR